MVMMDRRSCKTPVFARLPRQRQVGNAYCKVLESVSISNTIKYVQLNFTDLVLSS